jgi:hypothetical protein
MPLESAGNLRRNHWTNRNSHPAHQPPARVSLLNLNGFVVARPLARPFFEVATELLLTRCGLMLGLSLIPVSVIELDKSMRRQFARVGKLYGKN